METGRDGGVSGRSLLFLPPDNCSIIPEVKTKLKLLHFVYPFHVKILHIAEGLRVQNAVPGVPLFH